MTDKSLTNEPMDQAVAANVGFDPVLLTVLSNRFDSIVRDMTNTLLRAGRSAGVSVARDFSASIVTADNELLTAVQGLPVHVFGSHLQTESMQRLHANLEEGDAFLHNDPYMGNTHAADHTILVPVFADGEHLFTTVVKAHLADTGNSLPTTYMTEARDIYEEGALIFPCVRVQRHYREVTDIIRMCRRRIRVPEQWYGDFLAMVGAARIGERRIKKLISKYGVDLVRDFVSAWLDYSERCAKDAIARLPATKLLIEGAHDPFPPMPDGIPLRVAIEIDPANQIIDVDLRQNIDCIPAGLNLSQATSMNSAITGILNNLGTDVPQNAGAFRRIRVHIRENCVVGKPRFPASCSVATTNVADRIVNLTQASFAELGDGYGIAHGGNAMGIGFQTISGRDPRRDNKPFINQFILGNNGGPASPYSDGWIVWGLPVAAGVIYRDSVEVDEQKYPVIVKSMRLLSDTGGAGRYRGGPAAEIVIGPRTDRMTVMYLTDGAINPPEGVRGGLAGNNARAWRIDKSGEEHLLPPFARLELEQGEFVAGIDCGGGGYGDPLDREIDRVLQDVREGLVSAAAARQIYGVVVTGDLGDDSIVVDELATVQLRERMRASPDNQLLE